MFMFIKAYNKMKEPEEAVATEKACPTCAMKIPVEAKKCGHCGETNV
jgi:large conductance mechanosensitive channel